MGILVPKKNRPTDGWDIDIAPYDRYGHLFKWTLRDDHAHVMAEGWCGDYQDAVDAADIMREFYDERLRPAVTCDQCNVDLGHNWHMRDNKRLCDPCFVVVAYGEETP